MYEVKDRYDVIKSSNDDAIQAVVFRLQKSLELTRETATKLASVYATPELMNSFNWINGDIFCRDLVNAVKENERKFPGLSRPYSEFLEDQLSVDFESETKKEASPFKGDSIQEKNSFNLLKSAKSEQVKGLT